ncbi:hypothetical protein [Sphingomonas sp. G-3-2-10]|uniref:hypothetical protein n=1 Tax=Sphingomonas sp. G-3-2-10 TaxID=2728838 RepID=UPI00146A0A02|nr:hypothetical protein [Sphingomonas sp. G-3-2-10]NML04296.1 hypothetical protein [Sphingomonas sp. G-3-2-10]
MYIDIEQLCSDAQEFLDSDPRFFNENEGSFEYHYERVFFTKTPDLFVLEVQGIEVSCIRP